MIGTGSIEHSSLTDWLKYQLIIIFEHAQFFWKNIGFISKLVTCAKCLYTGEVPSQLRQRLSSWRHRLPTTRDHRKAYICLLASLLINYWLSTHTHTQQFNGPFPGLPGWAGTRKVKPIWILVKQVTVSGNGISWAICKSAPCSRQITMPAPHHWVFYRPDAFLPPNQQRQSIISDLAA